MGRCWAGMDNFVRFLLCHGTTVLGRYGPTVHRRTGPLPLVSARSGVIRGRPSTIVVRTYAAPALTEAPHPAA